MLKTEQFERLYENHAARLYSFLAYRTGDSALAEDLLGDTFERALRGRRGFDRRRASEKTWLYSIALNCLRDNARRGATEARAYERATAGVPAGAGVTGLEAVERSGDLERAWPASATKSARRSHFASAPT